jgi:hypothetical protein
MISEGQSGPRLNCNIVRGIERSVLSNYGNSVDPPEIGMVVVTFVGFVIWLPNRSVDVVVPSSLSITFRSNEVFT